MSENFSPNFFFQFLFPKRNPSGMHPLPCPPPAPRDGQCAAGTHPTGMHSCRTRYCLLLYSEVQQMLSKYVQFPPFDASIALEIYMVDFAISCMVLELSRISYTLQCNPCLKGAKLNIFLGHLLYFVDERSRNTVLVTSTQVHYLSHCTVQYGTHSLSCPASVRMDQPVE